MADIDSDKESRTAPVPAVGAAGEQLSCKTNNSTITGNRDRFNIFKAVKEQVTARQAAEYYGLHVHRNGMACCPFHPDKNPSMKLDARFHCFGCGADGDVIDYVSRMQGISKYEAAVRIARDFGICISGDELHRINIGISRKSMRENTVRKESKRVESKFSRWRTWATLVLSEYVCNLELWKRAYAPEKEADEWHPLFVEALQNLDQYNYYLDVLCFGTIDEQRTFFIDTKEKIREIYERNQICTRQFEDGSDAGRRTA